MTFIGSPGTVKTTSHYYWIKTISQGYKVLFSTVNEILEDLYISREDNSFQQRLKYYTSVKFIILDELGLATVSTE